MVSDGTSVPLQMTMYPSGAKPSSSKIARAGLPPLTSTSRNGWRNRMINAYRHVELKATLKFLAAFLLDEPFQAVDQLFASFREPRASLQQAT